MSVGEHGTVQIQARKVCKRTRISGVINQRTQGKIRSPNQKFQMFYRKRSFTQKRERGGEA